jgi:amino acid adenylation domain-containing protein/FkbM family methyltransferase
MVLYAGFATLLGRYAGQDDLVVGVPVAGRGRPELARAVGFYANTVALRADLSGDPTFVELLRRVRVRVLEAFDDQEVPYARVVEALRRGGRPAHAPVFRVMFALQNTPSEPFALAGVSLEPLPVSVGGTKFDLTLLASERSERLRLALEYRADLFDGETAARMVGHLGRLVTAAAAEPETKLSALPLMDEAERRLVLERWNDTARTYPDSTLTALLDAQATRTPDAPAVSFEEGTLSYAALHERADALAGSLRAAGAARATLVGVHAERSIDLVVALLATLEAGAAYVPLDPELPADRLAYMLEDAAPAVVLTSRALAPRLGEYRGAVILLDAPDTWPAPVAATSDAAPADAAYMIYTSGSTGRPKGALNAHRGIVNRLLWMQAQYGLVPADVVLQKTPYSFDVSVWEFFWPLLVGARLTLARPGGHRDPTYLAGLVERERVTVCHFVPSMLGAFLAELRTGTGSDCTSLRHVVCSGEALTADLVAGVHDALPGAALHNLYGPTECAVDVTHWTCTAADARAGHAVPIGRPVANTQLYVLDAHGAPLPVGVPGELHLAGKQVGLGYHGRPDLTAERFLPDPFSSAPGARMYRTGDRARWRADGAMEFLGRLDFQVKLRGFRIELGEIESTLAKHPAVARAAVALRFERGGELGAYVVPDGDRAGAVRRLAALDAAPAPSALPRMELPDGTTVFHRNRGETEFLYREIFEGEGYLRHGLELGDGDIAFDVGANVGLFTVFAGTAARDTRVYAFEPLPPVFDVLSANAALHAVQGRVFPCGLGSRSETVAFTFYPQNTVLSGRYASEEAESEVVRRYLANDGDAPNGGAPLEELLAHNLRSESYDCTIRTFSDVVRELGTERIDLLKIDVEKAEWDVLQGIDSADWPKIRQVVVEVHDVNGRLAQVLELLRGHGFTCVAEEERMLAGTGLYAVYARRADDARRPSRAEHEEGARVWRGEAALRDELRAHLGRQLPDYMVPSAIVFLAALPLTSSGKLDRRALPAPRLGVAADDAPPRGALEEVVASVWKQALQVDRVGRATSFFELGGHSLLVTRVVAALATLLRIQLPIRTMFEAPTVAGIAEALLAREPAAGQATRVAQLVLKVQSKAARPDAASASPMGTHA